MGVRQVESQHVLAWLMIIVVLTSLGFVLLVSFTQDRGSNEILSERRGDEGRLVESVTDEEGIRLGGKKAAIQFVFDKLAVSNRLDQEGVRDFYDNFDESILKGNLNPSELNSMEEARSSPEVLSLAAQSARDAKLKRRRDMKSKLRSFRSLKDVPAASYRPKSGKVLFKVTDAESAPFVAVAGDLSSDNTKPALKDSSASHVAEENDVKDDYIPSTTAEKKGFLENPLSTDLKSLSQNAAESKTATRRRTKHRNPLMKLSQKNKMSKAKKLKKVLSKDRIMSAAGGNVDSPVKPMENEVKVMNVKEDVNIFLEEAVDRNEGPMMNFPDDPSFRKRKKREVEAVSGVGGGFQKAEFGGNGFRRLPVENNIE